MISLLPSALGAAAFFSPPPQPAKSMEPANTQAIATILVFFNMDENLLDFSGTIVRLFSIFGRIQKATRVSLLRLFSSLNLT